MQNKVRKRWITGWIIAALIVTLVVIGMLTIGCVFCGVRIFLPFCLNSPSYFSCHTPITLSSNGILSFGFAYLGNATIYNVTISVAKPHTPQIRAISTIPSLSPHTYGEINVNLNKSGVFDTVNGGTFTGQIWLAYSKTPNGLVNISNSSMVGDIEVAVNEPWNGIGPIKSGTPTS